MTSRRRFAATLLSAAAVAAAPSAWAANDTPIHILVGFPAGGGSDVIARLLAERLERNWAAPCWWTTAPAPAARSPRSSSRPRAPTAPPCSSRTTTASPSCRR
ncbi:hypothetical protein [Ottowia beijingensis]|uniref:hypothetical protein n=1 Tax=Ottowia beijingensis TaxID=1207057 RepID=UPI0028058E61|nr:hypothetical protein [Ottowia beijingensis]